MRFDIKNEIFLFGNIKKLKNIEKKLSNRKIFFFEKNKFFQVLISLKGKFFCIDNKTCSVLNENLIISKFVIKDRTDPIYNLKSINFLSKKLNIDMMNFQILAALVVNTVFCSPKYLPKFMDFISDFNLSFKEFEKIMKLSPCFETYTKKWTKKFQKELISNFEDN